jgi:AraC family transcriptional regulator
MNVKLIERASTTVAYLRHVGPYGPSIGRFWRDTYYPWAARHQLLAQPRYGISHDDPGVTAPEQCRYDACVEVPADFVVPTNACKTRIPGGRYAALEFRGTDADIGAAWVALLRDWLPASGMQLDARPCFEYYASVASYDPASGVFECDICIPVAPL